MNLKEQIGVLISAAGIRRDQWKALADNFGELQAVDCEPFSPNGTIDELWEVWGGMDLDNEDTEAQDMTDIITHAINYVQAFEIDKLEMYGVIGDDMPTCPTCGTRCDIVHIFDDETQRLKCLNRMCAKEFIGEWEEETDE